MNPEDPNDAEATELERRLLKSAKLDVAPSSARRRALQAGRAVLEQQRRPQKTRLVPFAVGGALAVAAAFALFASRKPHPPVTEAAPERVASPAAPLPPPSATSATRPQCPSLVIARGDAPLIEDWEKKDSALLLLDGRRGSWTNYDDGTGKQNPPDHSALLPSRIAGGRGSSRQALHMSGGRFMTWGVTFGTELSDASCYDASAYAGFELWAKGKGTVRIGVQMIDVQDSKYGGFCKSDCFNSHRKVVELGKTWQKFSFRWEELRQLYPGGPRLELDPKRIRFLEFSIPAESTPYDIWVDDISFIPR
ncbi:MAG TPA: hypothetical protein VGK73_04225 [Polyangiaceae bacterium]